MEKELNHLSSGCSGAFLQDPCLEIGSEDKIGLGFDTQQAHQAAAVCILG